MKIFFKFSYRSKKYAADCQFLFKSVGKLNSSDLADAIKESLRKIIYPDLVFLVVVSKEEYDEMVRLCKENEDVRRELRRAKGKTAIGVVRLNSDGSFGIKKIVKGRYSNTLGILQEKDEIYRAGLDHLLDDPSILFDAPAGFVFLKPSGDRSSYFIRAEEAIFSTERVHFLACSALHHFCKKKKEGQAIETIFIDTMAIASVAYVFRDIYVKLFNIAFPPSIISFHSYGGMEGVEPPLPGKSLCIISASSTMNLQRKWIESKGCGEDEIITLFTLCDANGADKALYVLPKKRSELQKRDITGLKDLRIVRENFSPEEVPIKIVMLKAKQHGLKRCVEYSKNADIYSNKRIISAYQRDQSTNKVRIIYVDGNKLVRLKETRSYVKCVIFEHVPVSTKAIIYQSDDSSKKLAEYCSVLIGLQTGKRPSLYRADEISKDKFRREQGVLIVAAVIGRGTSLLSLSRDLRDIHKGPRNYLIGFQLGESWKDKENLEKNLKFSREGWSYNVSIMNFLAIGTTLNRSFRKEIEILQYSSINRLLTKDIKERLNSLEKEMACEKGAFLPSINGIGQQLKLRPSFVFWNDRYKDYVDHSGSVLATIAGILQNARELEIDHDHQKEYWLSSDAFQQVILDPDIFSRFNDGVIQAALLRSADKIELDFFSDKETSHRMKVLLKGIFSSIEKDQGEAALEFGLALATGKLKLTKDDEEEIVKFSKAMRAGQKKIKLLKALIGLIKKPLSDERPF